MTITVIDVLEGHRYRLELEIEKVERPFRKELADIERALSAVRSSKAATDERGLEPT